MGLPDVSCDRQRRQIVGKLIDNRQLHGAIDLTTTEVADYLFGGMLPCNADRFGAIARTGIPCVLSCGAIDMINFGAPNTMPARYANRLRHHHNPQVTLVRTSARENALMGRWMGEKSTPARAKCVSLSRRAAYRLWMRPANRSGIRRRWPPLRKRWKKRCTPPANAG